MRLGPTFLVLLCSLICVTNGAPPGEVGKKSNFGVVYTEEEDQLIVNQLQKILDHTRRPHGKSVWDAIAKKHYEKKTQGITGFFHERSAQSLRHRFVQVLIHNKPNTKVKVPEALINKFLENEAIKHPYTKEEDNFIIKELSKPFCAQVYSQSTYEALRAKHAIKLVARTPGFEHVRNEGSFRNHLVTMKHAGKFPKEILEKIHAQRKGASSSHSTTSNQQTDMQGTNEGQREDTWIADMIEELQNTDIEIDFSKLQ